MYVFVQASGAFLIYIYIYIYIYMVCVCVYIYHGVSISIVVVLVHSHRRVQVFFKACAKEQPLKNEVNAFERLFRLRPPSNLTKEY